MSVDNSLQEARLFFDRLDFEQAKRKAKQAIRSAGAVGNISEEVEALLFLGYICVKETGELDVAENVYLQALELVKEGKKYAACRAKLYYRLGGIYDGKDRNLAKRFYQQALSEFPISGEEKLLKSIEEKMTQFD